MVDVADDAVRASVVTLVKAANVDAITNIDDDHDKVVANHIKPSAGCETFREHVSAPDISRIDCCERLPRPISHIGQPVHKLMQDQAINAFEGMTASATAMNSHEV